MKRIWAFLWPKLKNKYIITLLVFTVWIIFFSQYNLIDRFRIARDIRQMEREKQYYKNQITQDSIRIHELTTDDENLEKFAREQYYMKKDNEEIFVVVEEED
jgi:cell division protein FtsB